MTKQKQALQRRSKGNVVLAGMVCIICLPWVLCAGTVTQEKYPLGFPENDVRAQMNYSKPNTVMDGGAVRNGNPDVADGVQSIRVEPKDSWLISENTMTPIRRQLWEAGVSASAEPEINPYKEELEQIINQICAIELNPHVQEPELLTGDETVSEGEPNTVIPDREPVQESPVEKGQDERREGAVSEQTLQRFNELTQNPEELTNPLELAEILFSSGCLREAAICYRAALNRRKGEEVDAFQDKAWIYLQLGNCLKDTNPQAALEHYQAVMVEFPYSLWTPLAKAKCDVINWYLENQSEIPVGKYKMNAKQ